MTDKKKLHQILSSLWKNDNSVGKTYYNQALQDVQTSIDLQEEPVSDIDFEQELYKAFGQVKDFTLCMRISKWFYDMGKNNQEHVSEDLGEYINELSKQFPEVSFAKLSRIAVRVAKWQEEQDNICYEEIFEEGAKWKNEQVTSKIINFLEMLGQGFTITDEVTHNTYKIEQLITDFKNYIKD